MRQDDTADRLTIVELAVREHLGYQTARDRALKGHYGPVERIGGRLFVLEAKASHGENGR